MGLMIGRYFDTLFSSINGIYCTLFHEERSPEIEKFIRNLSFVGLGTIIAIVFSFSFNILAARLLGPTEFGAVTLIQSVAMFLYIPMLHSLHTALVKYNAEKTDLLRQKRLISTTYILVLGFTVVTLVVYGVFSQEIRHFFSISDEFFYFSVLFAFLFVFYTLTSDTLRSLHMINLYSRLMPVFSGILLFSFLVFWFAGNDLTFRSPLFAWLLAYGLTGGITRLVIKNYLTVHFDIAWAKRLHQYSVYTLIGAISFTLYTNVDKLMINYF